MNVCLIGGIMTVAEIKAIGLETNRHPVVVYGFNPLNCRWTTLNVQRAEIGTRFGIFGLNMDRPNTRQVVILRSRKHCFLDERRGLGLAAAAYAHPFSHSPRRSAQDKKELARVNAQIATDALWDEDGELNKSWVEEIMSKKGYERMMLRSEHGRSGARGMVAR